MTTEQGDVHEQPTTAIAGAETIQGASERMPPIPDSIREAARLAPDHWLGMVDPAWHEEGEPPPWAVVGQWRSSPEGELVEWRDNEDYQPSPSTLGWPEPIDDVDATVQLAATGYGPGEAVVEALAALPEAAVFVTPEGDPLPATAPDGRTRVVPVFTSPAYLHAAGRLAFELMSVRELADRLPAGHVLYLNPSASVSMTVDTAMLREALDRLPADGGTEGDEVMSRQATVGGDVPVTRTVSGDG
ncbi:type VII secretion system-associated protein [Actinoallomurus purpureus]|uniref:type VII secretion system-associated protein n=1 Tax=Actinoallomurus purpureus TaxID=478114 RepID=UPI0020935C4C|nr:type VII secretion system-associated protein [Actinoallomurus purpureus]MCO6008474.1 type VII secretion system-associated protein [Actinoallomurus purpureus]